MSAHAATQDPQLDRIGWNALPFFLVHLSPLALFWVGFSWEGVLLCIGSYYLRIFGVTAGYHRYFSHRSFKTNRVVQFLLAFLAQTSLQKGVLWWSSHHRHHHRHSDEPEDVHSPVQRSFWYSHVGWILGQRWKATDSKSVRDLAKYPEIRWLDRYHLVPPVLYAIAIYLIWGWHGVVWGFGISSILVWHGTFTINSLSHVYGHRDYATTDDSRNNFLLALITLGEGWHNNHHHYQRSCAQGWRWYQLDITYAILRAMQAVGLVSGVAKPPRHIIENTIAHQETTAERIRQQLEALSERSAALKARAEQLAGEFRTAGEHARDAFEARAESLREAAAGLVERAEELRAEARKATEQARAQAAAELDRIKATAASVLQRTDAFGA